MKDKFTRLTLDQSDLHIEWSVPYEDISGEDMMQAIRTLMIGMTFSDSTVESSMANYLREHSNDYIVDDAIDVITDDEDKEPIEYNKEEPVKPHFYA